MLILGIDPGSNITGFGLVRVADEIQAVDFGHIKPKSNRSFAQKLETIFLGIEQLIETYKPSCVSIESQFVKNNVKAAMHLGMVKGIVLMAAAKAKIDIFEYAPKRVKAAVCHGNASKESIQKMIKLLLNLDEFPTPIDAADALALAYTHAKNVKVVNLKLVR